MSRKDFAIATSSETVDARVSTLIGAVAAAAAAGLAIALPTVAHTIAADPRRVASMLALTLVLQLFSVPVYGRAETLQRLGQRFAYAFARSDLYRPIVEPRELGEEWTFGNATVRFVDQPHGGPTSLGMRFDDRGKSAAYAIDFSGMSDDMAALYEGVDVWIADCLTRTPHPTHAHLDGVLGWARDLSVGQVYLTHMGNGLDYRTLIAELPDWAAPAYDGLEIDL